MLVWSHDMKVPERMQPATKLRLRRMPVREKRSQESAVRHEEAWHG